jgi:hypothetical protein
MQRFTSWSILAVDFATEGCLISLPQLLSALYAFIFRFISHLAPFHFARSAYLVPTSHIFIGQAVISAYSPHVFSRAYFLILIWHDYFISTFRNFSPKAPLRRHGLASRTRIIISLSPWLHCLLPLFLIFWFISKHTLLYEHLASPAMVFHISSISFWFRSFHRFASVSTATATQAATSHSYRLKYTSDCSPRYYSWVSTSHADFAFLSALFIWRSDHFRVMISFSPLS